MSKIDLVVACTLGTRGIGYKGTLPWCLPKQSKYFKNITSKGPEKNCVIVGRKSFDDVGKLFPNRHNIVLTTRPESLPEGAHAVRSLDEALNKSQQLSPQGRVFVIGGTALFQEAIPRSRYIFETRINKKYECDTFMPVHNFPAGFVSKTFSEKDASYDFVQYYNPKFITPETFVKDPIMPKERHQEYQYIDLIKDILDKGYQKGDRTGTGTKGLFGNTMRYDLSHSFPLLTTKKVFWRGVVEELLWFIKGSTNSNLLKQKKVHIWDGNGSRAYLDSIGLKHRQQGDLGPVYGFQWRHWGADYSSIHADYSGKGIDQLKWIISQIRTNPNSRRLLMSAWNPSQLPEMALPPCHVMCHFHVTADKRLSCVMYQRSCDVGLGVPFNIASYALLTCMIAQVCGLGRGEFVHMMGDTHLYLNHIDKLQPELSRTPYPFPGLQLNPEIKDIDNFKLEDIVLENYTSHGKIEMKMAV